MTALVKLGDIFDGETFQTVESSPFSYITRAYFHLRDDKPAVAIKSASYLPEFSKEPHDIVKELRLINALSHINVVELLGSTYEESSSTLHFWMPFIPYSLSDLLDCATLSFHGSVETKEAECALGLVRSLVFQTTVALRYLHENHIAHRDIKPRNILINTDGIVKLIDFGISWSETISSSADSLWPEPPGSLCPQVSSGPYRAPETIFGATYYNPYAVDLWSLGATVAEFFTPLRFVSDDEGVENEYDSCSTDDEASLKQRNRTPLINAPTSESQRGRWQRLTLFDAERGSIGLAWSIFKIRGSPNHEIWPTFMKLPDASKVTFQDVEPVDMRECLPNLPPSLYEAGQTSHLPPPSQSNCALDFLWRLLVYPPLLRMSCKDALRHFWMCKDPMLLPVGYPLASTDQTCIRPLAVIHGSSLSEVLQVHLHTHGSR